MKFPEVPPADVELLWKAVKSPVDDHSTEKPIYHMWRDLYGYSTYNGFRWHLYRSNEKCCLAERPTTAVRTKRCTVGNYKTDVDASKGCAKVVYEAGTVSGEPATETIGSGDLCRARHHNDGQDEAGCELCTGCISFKETNTTVDGGGLTAR